MNFLSRSAYPQRVSAYPLTSDVELGDVSEGHPDEPAHQHLECAIKVAPTSLAEAYQAQSVAVSAVVYFRDPPPVSRGDLLVEERDGGRRLVVRAVREQVTLHLKRFAADCEELD